MYKQLALGLMCAVLVSASAAAGYSTPVFDYVDEDGFAVSEVWHEDDLMFRVGIRADGLHDGDGNFYIDPGADAPEFHVYLEFVQPFVNPEDPYPSGYLGEYDVFFQWDPDPAATALNPVHWGWWWYSTDTGRYSESFTLDRLWPYIEPYEFDPANTGVYRLGVSFWGLWFGSANAFINLHVQDDPFLDPLTDPIPDIQTFRTLPRLSRRFRGEFERPAQRLAEYVAQGSAEGDADRVVASDPDSAPRTVTLRERVRRFADELHRHVVERREERRESRLRPGAGLR